MAEAISNTSPLVYLHRAGIINWLPQLFSRLWIPTAVSSELQEGRRLGFDVPDPQAFSWLEVVDPDAIPSEWLTQDPGAGELNALALALENPTRIVLLDDARARRVGQAAGLVVWGTLRILLEGKALQLTPTIAPWIDRLAQAGMWLSDDIRARILALANEA